MESLPIELEDIIYKYKHELDFRATLDEINKINYRIEIDNGFIQPITSHRDNICYINYVDRLAYFSTPLIDWNKIYFIK